jgi:transcriptional regulator NrdR family protein
MKRQINCRKCGNKFETEEIICTQSSYVIKGTDIPVTFTRLQNRKCQLCRNMEKAFNYVNERINKNEIGEDGL